VTFFQTVQRETIIDVTIKIKQERITRTTTSRPRNRQLYLLPLGRVTATLPTEFCRTVKTNKHASIVVKTRV